MKGENERLRARDSLHLVWRPLVVLAAVLACGIASRNCWPLAELRYLETCREMLELDEFVLPHLKHLIYLHKLPFVFWQVIALSELGGVSLDLAARLVPALWAGVFVVACALLALRLTRDERLAERAGMLAALSPGTLYLGQTFLFDMPLAALVASTLAVAAGGLARRRTIPQHAWFCLGLALFTKGPVALLVTLPPLAVLVLNSHGPAGLRPSRRHAIALLWCLAPSLTWLAFVYARIPWLDFRELVLGQTAGRLSGRLGHREPFWFYLPIAALHTLPALLLWRRARRAPRPLRALGLCAAGLVLVFSVIPTKAPHYVFPLLPLALPWLAWSGLTPPGEPERARFGQALLRLCSAALLVGAGLLASGILAALVDGESAMRSLVARDLAATPKLAALLALPALVVVCFVSARRLGLLTRFGIVVAAGSLVVLPILNRLQLPNASLELLARHQDDGKQVLQLRDRFHGNFHYLLADGGLAAAEDPAELDSLARLPGTLTVGFESDAGLLAHVPGLRIVRRDTFFARVLCVWAVE